jgi:hypothetical protein
MTGMKIANASGFVRQVACIRLCGKPQGVATQKEHPTWIVSH